MLRLLNGWQGAGSISAKRTKSYSEPRLGDAGILFRRLLVGSRQSKGWNQTQLGRRLGMSQVLVSRLENGDRKVDVLELRLICRALKVDFVEFVRELDAQLGEHEKNPAALIQPDPEPGRKKRP